MTEKIYTQVITKQLKLLLADRIVKAANERLAQSFLISEACKFERGPNASSGTLATAIAISHSPVSTHDIEICRSWMLGYQWAWIDHSKSRAGGKNV